MKRLILAIVAFMAMASPLQAQNDGLVRDDRFMIYFEANSAELSPTAKSVLEMIVSKYADNDRAVFYLSGHTDTLRLASINLVLSATMANSVASHLETLGVPETRISRAAFGESSLEKKTEDGVGEPLNRRVVINVYVPQAGAD